MSSMEFQCNFVQNQIRPYWYDLVNSFRFICSSLLDIKLDRRLIPLLAVLLLAACAPGPPEAGNDTIELLSNDGNDEAVVILDGSLGSGCLDDEVYRTQDSLSSQNLVTRSGCTSQMVVLSDDDRLMLVSPFQPAWTDSANETRQINLSDLLVIPITIWLADPSPTVRANFQQNAQTHRARLLQLYNTNNTGIAFQFTENIIDDVVQVNTVRNTVQQIVDSQQCNTGAVEGDAALFDSDAINVYYATFSGVNGIACKPDFIGMTAATPETLAHEIGHTLDLRHYGINASDNDNVMWWTGVQNRDNLTIGQAFRANLNPASGMNALNIRSGSTRHCEHDTISTDCPDIRLDVTPK